jgi:predicted metalloprotease with PDZ domain
MLHAFLRIRRRVLAALVVSAPLLPGALLAQDPLARYSDAFEAQLPVDAPALHYTVHVDPADLGGYAVELRVRNAPDTLRLQLPEWAPGAYRMAGFARYVRDLAMTAGERALRVARTDSSTWVAATPGGEVTVRYRIAYPNATAARTPNNRGFLRETGGLVDGPATFVYLAGRKLLPAHVTFAVPARWRIATGLVPTADPRTFFAPSYDVLIDSPALLGELREWRFAVDGVPHRVAYWPLSDAAPFDTAGFVRAVQIVSASFRERVSKQVEFKLVDVSVVKKIEQGQGTET